MKTNDTPITLKDYERCVICGTEHPIETYGETHAEVFKRFETDPIVLDGRYYVPVLTIAQKRSLNVGLNIVCKDRDHCDRVEAAGGPRYFTDERIVDIAPYYMTHIGTYTTTGLFSDHVDVFKRGEYLYLIPENELEFDVFDNCKLRPRGAERKNEKIEARRISTKHGGMKSLGWWKVY